MHVFLNEMMFYQTKYILYSGKFRVFLSIFTKLLSNTLYKLIKNCQAK
jgi:hypothetical protein